MILDGEETRDRREKRAHRGRLVTPGIQESVDRRETRGIKVPWDLPDRTAARMVVPVYVRRTCIF